MQHPVCASKIHYTYWSNGQVVRLPTAILLSGVACEAEFSGSHPAPPALKIDSSVVSIVEEQLTIGKQSVDTGTVRLERRFSMPVGP